MERVTYHRLARVTFPEAASLITATIRRRLLLRFPYALLSSIKPDKVRVLAVMNLKRRPMYWVGRERPEKQKKNTGQSTIALQEQIGNQVGSRLNGETGIVRKGLVTPLKLHADS